MLVLADCDSIGRSVVQLFTLEIVGNGKDLLLDVELLLSLGS